MFTSRFSHEHIIYVLSATVLLLSVCLTLSLSPGSTRASRASVKRAPAPAAAVNTLDSAQNGTVNTSVFVPNMPAEVTATILD